MLCSGKQYKTASHINGRMGFEFYIFWFIHRRANRWIQTTDRGSGHHHPGKSQVATGFLKNSDEDPTREAIGLLGSNCPSRLVHTALCEIR